MHLGKRVSLRSYENLGCKNLLTVAARLGGADFAAFCPVLRGCRPVIRYLRIFKEKCPMRLCGKNSALSFNVTNTCSTKYQSKYQKSLRKLGDSWFAGVIQKNVELEIQTDRNVSCFVVALPPLATRQAFARRNTPCFFTILSPSR